MISPWRDQVIYQSPMGIKIYNLGNFLPFTAGGGQWAWSKWKTLLQEY